MDQAIRNKLRGVVTQCRKLLEDSVSQELQGKFAVYAVRKDDVQVDDEGRMSHLTDEERVARKDILDHFTHIKARGFKAREALDQLVREIAFTHLNRLCAYKMMEARQVYVGEQRFREAVSRGINSNGVKFYLADHSDDERLFTTGHQDVAYRHFLDRLGELLSEEIGVLFNPHDPANRLYPPQRVLDEVLALINDEALADIWVQDETIGWVYQYFTPKELRDQARKESQAPRNSYELAFRNQFFTPRYVVEFLTDNTLGRIWFEMRKGDTKLKDQCRYMVRRPSEVFLAEGQKPEDAAEGRDDLPQEELLKLPVYIPHRPKKDPRELKILDPACGSGHFLLYCFALLLTIYEEAYADPDLGPALKKDYPTLTDLMKAVPGLILAHNLHGIDIDLRATQIAALALWLRCQRAYQDMGLKKDRPKITRSNFVCAEPMPGEQSMLKEFVGQLEPKLLGQLVEVVFDKMKLAGEAGSLLKIEEEIRDAVAAAKKQWVAGPVSIQRSMFDDDEPVVRQHRFDFSGITDTQFFEQAEAKVVDALRAYAEKAQNGQRLQRRLFTEDAVRGFAFVDLCHKRFDVMLMNPPFGEGSKPAKSLIEKQYPRTKNDIYAAFVEQGLHRLLEGGFLGAITSRSGLFLSSFQKWREEILLGDGIPTVVADLGYGVLDTAMVETAAYCVEKAGGGDTSTFFRLLRIEDKQAALNAAVTAGKQGNAARVVFHANATSFGLVPGSPFAYWVSDRVRSIFTTIPAFESHGRYACKTNPAGDDRRYFRCWWEVPSHEIGREQRWVPLAKGGAFCRYYSDLHLVIDWDEKEFTFQGFEGTSHRPLKRPASADHFFRAGITYSSRTQLAFSARVLPKGCIFHAKGPGIFPNRDEELATIALMNSKAYQALLLMQISFGSYEIGIISRTPVPLGLSGQPDLAACAAQSIDELRKVDTYNECSHLFVRPWLVRRIDVPLSTLADEWDAARAAMSNKLTSYQQQIEDISYRLYGIDERDRQAIEEDLTPRIEQPELEQESDDDDEGVPESNHVGMVPLATSLLSYSVGCVLGRWDIRCATGQRPEPALPDPFDSLPKYAPGVLHAGDNLPPSKTPPDYPFRIIGDGILVDDPDHPDDILRRVRDVLEVIWKDRAEAIEQEACEILGVKELRDYIRRPSKGGFWDDHVSRYSKSRRKAPIYWLLQSGKKNYALWLYYHRLDKDLLFKALVNYVEPKIRLEDSRLETLRTQKGAAGDSRREAKRLGKEVERQEEIISELRDFEDKLRRAANLHLEPDLNDGVVLNIAPLHELVPWKEAKNYWQELLDGKYEWSSIAKQLREKGLVQ